MTRRFSLFVCLLALATLVIGCADQSDPVRPQPLAEPVLAIVDGQQRGDPTFLWLPPTVPSAPALVEPFDATALGELAVEVCQLGTNGLCSGSPLERFTATGNPVPNRITMNAAGQYYTVTWLSGRTHVSPDNFYRVRVLRDGMELGFIDVDVVRNTPQLKSVDASQYIGLVAGQQLTIRFRIQAAPIPTTVRINEVESSGGTPGDWVELHNSGTVAINLSGWVIKDNDDTHVATLAAGTTIAAGGFLVIDESVLGYGLGGAESARLYAPNGTLVDSYSWLTHAATTYGRCPDGTGAFQLTTVVTKGAANNCLPLPPSVVFNEVESSGGTPGDWAELYNAGATTADLSGYVFRDNDDTHTYVLPAGSTIPAGGYLVLDEATFGFGLGGAESVRLFAPGGATLVDSYTWTAHASTTYGRCPNGTGAFTTTAAPSRGAANVCAGGPAPAAPWPGSQDAADVDGVSVFAGNMSGLVYEGSGSAAPGVLWAARNGPGTVFRLVFNGSIWTPDAANGWVAGKALRYPNGLGNPDAEGITFAGSGPMGGLYIATERNNDASTISRNSILRVDPAGAGGELVATHEWNITGDIPANGANLGLEAITWVPDAFLVARQFIDEVTNLPYSPANYPNHGTGLFFVGVEGSGMIHAYALDHVGGGFTRIASFTSGFTGVMALEFDRELNNLWAMCDDTCNGRSAILEISAGAFAVTRTFDRPTNLLNVNNEGFAIAPLAECNAGTRPSFWADDSETGGHAIRRGLLTCLAF